VKISREVSMQKMGILLNRLAASIQNQLWILDPASLRKKAGTTSPAGRGAFFCLVFDNSQIQDYCIVPRSDFCYTSFSERRSVEGLFATFEEIQKVRNCESSTSQGLVWQAQLS